MSRIWTKLVSRWDDDLGRYVTVEDESVCFEYDGEVALCKGDNTAKDTEKLQQQNVQQNMDFQTQMMGLFTKQFGAQQDVLNYLKGKMTPIIDKGGTGYSDQALASMRTSATDNISGQFQNAQKALQAQQYVSGGRDLPSGVNAQVNASLMNSEAQTNAGAQNQITQSNENLKQANYWNAVNELNGVGAQFNPQSYGALGNAFGGNAIGAGNSVANLSNAYSSSQSAGFWNHLADSFGSTLGSTLGGGNAGKGSAGGLAGFFGA